MLNTKVKKGVKKTKQNQLENKIKQLESDFRANSSHNLFKTVRDLSGKPRKTLNVVKDKKGVKHTLAHEVLKCWENHFKEHLNTEFPRDSAAINNINIPHNDQNHIEDINKEEIRKAIRGMKNRKSPGIDIVTSEALKAGGEPMIGMLHKILSKLFS